jgi:hypothetical protein
MPSDGAPCTSTARAGRWRSFLYLAELGSEDGDASWSSLCRQSDDEENVNVPRNGGSSAVQLLHAACGRVAGHGILCHEEEARAFSQLPVRLEFREEVTGGGYGRRLRLCVLWGIVMQGGRREGVRSFIGERHPYFGRIQVWGILRIVQAVRR